MLLERSNPSASKRVARGAAWMPTHSAEQWSTAMNTAAWPSPVIVVVRSVPHIMSTASGMMVPSWLRGAARRSDTRRGEQIVLSREPQHPAFRGPHTGNAQPRPDLAVAFTVERASGKDGAD